MDKKSKGKAKGHIRSMGKRGVWHKFITVTVIVLAIFGIIGIYNFATKKTASPTSLTVTPTANAQGNTQNPVPANTQLNLFGKTTVTFDSWDFYINGNNAGTGHLLLVLKDKDGKVKLKGRQYNDLGTETATAPGDSYQVLLGNKTTSLTAGTDYYPLLVSGTLADKETDTISGGQYKTAGAAQVTFTFYNKANTAGSAQALTTSDDKTVKFEVAPNAQACVGNPDTSGSNVITFNYNNSVFTNVIQYDASGLTPQATSSAGTPNGATAISGINPTYSKASYDFPIVCGPASQTRSVQMKTGTAAEPTSAHNINVTMSDVSWCYNSNTFEVSKAYVDNNNNDCGVADFLVGNLLVS